MASNHLVAGSPSGVISSPVMTFTLDVADFLGADRFYAAGFDGTGAVVANVEAGHAWSGHESLSNVTQFVESATPAPQLGETDRHATWVASMIAGSNGGPVTGAWQTGIAPGAELWSGAIATQWNGAPYALSFTVTGDSFVDAYVEVFQTGISGRTADVVNSSWGFTQPSGFNFIAGALDALSVANPQTTFVASAGNEGPGVNTVGGPGAQHNVITVAALTGSGGANPYSAVASFSSRGPNDYEDPNGVVEGVRAVVDIAAPGTSLTGAFYGGTTGGNTGGTASGDADDYSGNLQGTSFSSPTVAGGVTLMVDSAYTAFPSNPNARDARVTKAVLLNAADKEGIPGWDNGQALDSGVIRTTQSLDYATGAGRMDLDRTFDQYLPEFLGGLAGTTDLVGMGGGTVAAIGWDFGEVGENSPTDYLIGEALEGGTNLTVTLDWFRDRTLVSSNLVTDDSFDNLDLEVWLAQNGLPNQLVAESASIYNNVEHLYFELPEDGAYLIRVDWAGEVFDLVDDPNVEQYGLAWFGTALDAPLPEVIPEPPTLALLLIGAAALLLRLRRR